MKKTPPKNKDQIYRDRLSRLSKFTDLKVKDKRKLTISEKGQITRYYKYFEAIGYTEIAYNSIIGYKKVKSLPNEFKKFPHIKYVYVEVGTITAADGYIHTDIEAKVRRNKNGTFTVTKHGGITKRTFRAKIDLQNDNVGTLSNKIRYAAGKLKEGMVILANAGAYTFSSPNASARIEGADKTYKRQFTKLAGFILGIAQRYPVVSDDGEENAPPWVGGFTVYDNFDAVEAFSRKRRKKKGARKSKYARIRGK